MDAAKTIDLLKIRFYNEYLYTAHIYDEGESGYHQQLTAKVVNDYIDPLKLPLDSAILDLGCGPGYFMDEMKVRNYSNVVGVTLSEGDVKLCESKGHTVKEYDLSFLPSKDGYIDESVDLIFLRHALEHSPYPIFSLIEYNRLLKSNGKIYIEVPAPNCERLHEYNPNHYSIFGAEQLKALLQRTGFDIDKFDTLEFTLNMPVSDTETKEVKEQFYCIVASKKRSLDLK